MRGLARDPCRPAGICSQGATSLCVNRSAAPASSARASWAAASPHTSPTPASRSCSWTSCRPNLTDAEKKNRAARNRFAARGLEKALKARPAAFFHQAIARASSRSATPRTTSTSCSDCDLVIEAVIEQLEPKRALFEKLEKVVKSDCIVASNTSGLRIDDMMAGPRGVVPEALPRDALLQPRPVHEAPRARGGARHDRPRRSSASAASARTCWARASSSARTRRTSSATASAVTR